MKDAFGDEVTQENIDKYAAMEAGFNLARRTDFENFYEYIKSQRKQLKKDYEILEWCYRNESFCGESLIKSIKRLSDGEIFSIGDKMKYYGDSDEKDMMYIIHFSLKDDQIFVNNHYAGTPNVRIKDWIKENKNKSLFTTEQQKEIISIVKKAIKDAI